MCWIAFAIILPAWLICTSTLHGQKLETHKQDHKTITRVETAIDHLTVIELGEPVTMVAAGNQGGFLVERRDNKVFVKPTEEGAQTNLFIWTGTGRYAYELVPAKTVAEMHFAIDQESPIAAAGVPAAAVVAPLPALPAEMLTQATPVSVYGERESQGRVEVSIRDLYQKDNRIYLRYALLNRSGIPYRTSAPAAWQLIGVRATHSLIGLGANQLGERICRTLKVDSAAQLNVVNADQASRVEAGRDGMGWLVIDAPSGAESNVAVLRLRFAADAKGDLAAVVILPSLDETVREVANAGRNASPAHR
jgi:hypothetical protein